jgi:GalNAc-alpha-(1->4)-GalNAc-alpha-(1->3)-diNAcBac-PP-undecaprenol alpha-1,4-N-acetyl-D-galactosaminyltransferase
LLESADIFVLASEAEGFPGALVEAMSCGLAVISSDCSVGPAAIIKDGIDGDLVGPSHVDSLAQAIRRILDDDVERRRLGEKASEVNTGFSLRTIMNMWDELILGICGVS